MAGRDEVVLAEAGGLEEFDKLQRDVQGVALRDEADGRAAFHEKHELAGHVLQDDAFVAVVFALFHVWD